VAGLMVAVELFMPILALSGVATELVVIKGVVFCALP